MDSQLMTARCIPERQTTRDATANFILFLKLITPDWASTFNVFSQDRETEADIEPLLFEFIEPIVRSYKVLRQNRRKVGESNSFYSTPRPILSTP